MDRRQVIRHGLAGAAALAFAPDLLRALGRERPYLEAALRASRWLERSAQRRGSEILWSADPDRPAEVGYDLYNGTTGVLPFWVELHAATGEPRALEFVQGSADHLVRALGTMDRANAGLYTGLSGVGFALGLAWRATRDEAHRQGALRALELVRDAAHDPTTPAPNADVTRSAARWADSTDIISGSAGTGLYLLWAHRLFGDARDLRLAREAGHDLVANAQTLADGRFRWRINATMPREYPNFSHGTAGVAYFLARLHEATREPVFLGAAIGGARYLQDIATTTAHDGRMVHHSTPGNEQLFYLSWCHGPAGTARLFHALARLTDDATYARYAEQLATATLEQRVPERSPGFWNNVSMCCGNCGVSEYFVARHGLVQGTAARAEALAFAERVAQDTLARATPEGDALKWVQAENRTSPQAVVAQTGLMQGAAGVGLAMLHLDGAIAGRRRAVVLPDDPFA
jgi:lantibiotic modifying enzyme